MSHVSQSGEMQWDDKLMYTQEFRNMSGISLKLTPSVSTLDNLLFEKADGQL